MEEVAVLKMRFNFITVGEVWTAARRGKVASMTMHSWDELWRVVKEIKAARLHPPECQNLYWAGMSRTQEERERSAMIIAACKAFRDILEQWGRHKITS